MLKCHTLLFDTFQISEEERMAKVFSTEVQTFFSGADGEIFVVPSLRKGRDMDLVVWMHFEKVKLSINTGFINNPDLEDQKEYKRRTKRDVWINSVFLLIELKKHNTQDSISIKNGKLYVKYGNEFKNSSDQNFDQVFYLQSFLAERLNLPKSKIPKIHNFIWLYKCVDKPSGYDELDNVIYGDLIFNELFEQMCRKFFPISYDEGHNISLTACNKDTNELLDNYFDELKKEKANGLGMITHNKLEIIVRKQIDIDNNQKINEIGNKITLIKGKPGTGKTIHLIYLAYHLSEDEYKPLILTYNKALVQDIERMIHYSGFYNSVKIKTIHSFFYGLLISNEFIDSEEISFECYESKLVELSNYIDNEDANLIRTVLNIKYDTILIDEAQDCEEIEKNLLLKIFGPENIVLSIGSRQIVRKKEVDWVGEISRNKINLINLKISYRNKKDLVDYFNAFSIKHYHIIPWDLRENSFLTGGKLFIILNDNYNKQIHNQLVKELIKEGNSMYDLMYLVPSETKGKNFAKELSRMLDNWNFKSFDNTIKENKEKYFPIDEHRILNYQSCRGLEAWILICWNLDIIIKNIKSYYADIDEYNPDNVKIQVNNWLLMIFTRAIDTLVLTFENLESEEAQMILSLVKSESFSHMSFKIDS